MMDNKKALSLLKKHLKARNLTWEKYLERFNHTKPLKLLPTDCYPRKFDMEGVTWDFERGEIDLGLSDTEKITYIYRVSSTSFAIKKMERDYKPIVCCNKKATKEEIQQLPYIDVAVDLTHFLLHREVIEIMNRICPEDFQAIAVKIINKRKDTPYFEIDDFYTINLLKCIDAIDRTKSIIKWDHIGSASVKKLRYKKDPWQEGARNIIVNGETEEEHFRLDKPCKIAIDLLSEAPIWHPDLVSELPKESYHWFKRDLECDDPVNYCYSDEEEEY